MDYCLEKSHLKCGPFFIILSSIPTNIVTLTKPDHVYNDKSQKYIPLVQHLK